MFVSILEGSDKSPFFMGQWDGLRHRDGKHIVVKFMPDSINVNINGDETLYETITYTETKKDIVIVTSEVNFDALGIESNQFKIRKKFEGIGIYHGKYTIEVLFPYNKDDLVNGWDMKSHNIQNYKCIYVNVALCSDTMKAQELNANFSFNAIKKAREAVFVDLTDFDKAQLPFHIDVSTNNETLEYKKMHQCVTYIIQKYSPMELGKNLYKHKNRQQIKQEIKEQVLLP
jgi:hypothetical protein